MLSAIPAHAEDSRLITGKVTYATRMALPPDAELVVEVTGFQDATLGSMITTTEGRQVPLPFTVESPSDLGGRLQAAIRVDGGIRWISDPVAIPASGASVALGTLHLSPFEFSGFESTVQCGDQMMTIGFRGDEAILQTDEKIYTLSPAISADGAKYSSEDGKTVFWSRGASALVTLEGEDLPDCEIVQESDDVWEAQGNEPGWNARIMDERMALNLNYGADRLDLALPAPGIFSGAYHYSFDSVGLSMAVSDQMCRDDMTGRLFPQMVRLDTAAGTQRGCGGNSLSLLAGEPWTVNSIGSTPLTDSQWEASLSVDENGRIYGTGGCNRFNGAFSLSGEGRVDIGPLASTGMACDAGAMEQEQSLYSALGSVDGFDIDDSGNLILMAGGTPMVELSR